MPHSAFRLGALALILSVPASASALNDTNTVLDQISTTDDLRTDMLDITSVTYVTLLITGRRQITYLNRGGKYAPL